MPSSLPIHNHEDPDSCNCRDCLCRRFHEGTSYWASNTYADTVEVASEHSENSTMSGLPGPGRTLDIYIQIESAVGQIMEAVRRAWDLAFGAIATRDRLVSRISKCNEETDTGKRDEIWRKIMKDCRLLLEFIERCASSSLGSCDD